jgi:uncharacterized membrane protein (GlpM family)
MDAENPPPPEQTPNESTQRQRTTVYFGCALLISYAVILLALPSAKLSLPARLAFAAGNLVAAAVLWLVARQSSKK